MTTYCLTAGALGIGWYVVLLLPGVTRGWLLESPLQNLVLLVAASVLVALLCRRFISTSESLRGHLLRALVIPFIGCLVYLTLCAGVIWFRSIVFGGLANVHDTLSLYAMGLTAAALSFPVVVPYGFLCQRVLAPLSAFDDDVD